MSYKRKFWTIENIVCGTIALVCGVTLILSIKHHHDTHITVCETRTSKVAHMFREVESINSYGATRNNYYLYLEDGKRITVNMDEYALSKEGDSWNYQECWVERK